MDNTKMFIYAYSYTFSLQKSDDIIDDVEWRDEKYSLSLRVYPVDSHFR